MAREDVAAGRMKQARGKANDVIGAIKGDTRRQLKGKVQKAMGKVQTKLGKASSASASASKRRAGTTRSTAGSRRGM